MNYNIDPKKITPLTGTPINRLFFAINHYVSTGDHFGEGMAAPSAPGWVTILIPVNVSLQQDQADFEAFRSRFDELAAEFGLTMAWHGEEGGFELWSFDVREQDADRLATALRERPGKAGWGSGKAVIDRHRWEG